MQLVMDKPQELTLVFPHASLEQVLRTVLDVGGTRCVILTEEKARSMMEEIEDREANGRKKWLNQTELMNREHIGAARLKDWEAKGLQKRKAGKAWEYNVDQLEQMKLDGII